MSKVRRVAAIAAVFAGISAAQSPTAPHDRGPRSGLPGAGGSFPTLNASEKAAFTNGIDQFLQEEGVPDVPAGSGNGGLGPGFNGTSCGSCHKQPATLGSSPAVNPQVAAAKAMGARNTIPSFIRPDGPVREARFVKNPDGTPDGGVAPRTVGCITCLPLPEDRMLLGVIWISLTSRRS